MVSFACVCFFFKYRLNIFFQISYKWYSMEKNILVSIMDGFFLLLVYSVKKIDCCGKKDYISDLVFQKWRGGKTEINPSSRNKQICRHSCRKSRLYVCQRDTTPSLYLPSHFSLSLHFCHKCIWMLARIWTAAIFFPWKKISPSQIQGKLST